MDKLKTKYWHLVDHNDLGLFHFSNIKQFTLNEPLYIYNTTLKHARSCVFIKQTQEKLNSFLFLLQKYGHVDSVYFNLFAFY